MPRKSKVIADYQVKSSKENNQQFSVGMDDMLETDKAFTSNISQSFINACKLQLRDHTYTMIHQFLTKPTDSPATGYKLAKAHQSLID